MPLSRDGVVMQRLLAWSFAAACVLAAIAARATREISWCETAYPPRPWVVEALSAPAVRAIEQQTEEERYGEPHPPVREVFREGRWWRLESRIYVRVSAYSPYDDPGHGVRYANQNFLPGGASFDGRAFPRSETRVSEAHYTVAVPDRYRDVHLARTTDGADHAYRIEIPGYGWAVPRDRLRTRDRWDCLMTGWMAQQRARAWGVRSEWIEIWRAEE